MRELIYNITSKPEIMEQIKNGKISLSVDSKEIKKAILEAIHQNDTDNTPYKYWR